MAQTFTDFEVILVDDGSTDGTPAICDAYAQKDSRITVVHKNNEGVSVARNAGIEKASGEYFYFFDGDDFAKPETFADLYSSAQNTKADMLLFGYYRYQNGEVTETCPPVFEPGSYAGADITGKLLARFVGLSYNGINRWLCGSPDGLYVENPALWRSFIKASIIKENGLFFQPGLRVGEDTIFICDCLSCAQSCHVLQQCYYYLVGRESSTIARYEENAPAKLEEKEKLLAARKALTQRVLERCGADIAPYWQGTVVMSAIELAFLFSKRGTKGKLGWRYRQYLHYAKQPQVVDAATRFKPEKRFGILPLPFWFLKWKWHAPLFMATTVVGLTPYRFQRGGGK